MTGETEAIRLNNAQLASFEENGFLAIERLLEPEDIEPIEADIGNAEPTCFSIFHCR